MRRRAKSRGADSDSESLIDLTPLVDVVFLLLLFFLLASNLDARKSLPINLPESSSGQASADNGQCELTIDATGAFALNGAGIEITASDWHPRVRDCIVQLRADKLAQHQWVVSALAALQTAQAKNVSVEVLSR